MRMRQERTTRAIKISAVLAVLLLVFTLVGSGVWHDHRGESSANCQTCHLSHQTATSHLVASNVAAPVVIGITALPMDTTRVAGPEIPFNIARAPPLA